MDRDDAGYVDVIHTDMPPRDSIVGLGMRRDAGHTDFYVNGGIRQPGCARNLKDLGRLQKKKYKIRVSPAAL